MKNKSKNETIGGKTTLLGILIISLALAFASSNTELVLRHEIATHMATDLINPINPDSTFEDTNEVVVEFQLGDTIEILVDDKTHYLFCMKTAFMHLQIQFLIPQ